jgi:hypothetical protein
VLGSSVELTTAWADGLGGMVAAATRHRWAADLPIRPGLGGGREKLSRVEAWLRSNWKRAGSARRMKANPLVPKRRGQGREEEGGCDVTHNQAVTKRSWMGSCLSWWWPELEASTATKEERPSHRERESAGKKKEKKEKWKKKKGKE